MTALDRAWCWAAGALAAFDTADRGARWQAWCKAGRVYVAWRGFSRALSDFEGAL